MTSEKRKYLFSGVMTTIQWEEDWFTVLPGNKPGDKPGDKPEAQEKPDDKPGDHVQQIQEIHQRLEELSLLVQQQSQQIAHLTRELQELKQQPQPQQPQQSHSAATQIADLLEELKRVKERELNYALRRHVAVPFFDSGMLQRMAGLAGLDVNPPRSPLFLSKATATATRGPNL